MKFPLPTSIFFNLAKEKPIIINGGRLYTLGGNKSDNFLSLSGERINISESDSLLFFEQEYKSINGSKIKNTLSKILDEKYNIKIYSSKKEIGVIDFIINKVFYEYNHYYSNIDVNIDFSNISCNNIKTNYILDVNIDFSEIEKSVFESIIDNVFLDSNSVFSLDELSTKKNIHESGNFVSLNKKNYLIQPTNFFLDSLEKKYQEALLREIEKNELKTNKALSKKLESVDKQKKLNDILESLNKNGFYEKNKKGIYKKNSKFLPYIATDNEFVLQNKETNKYFLFEKFRIAVDIKKSNGEYAVNEEPFVLERKFHPFVYYDTDKTSWRHKKNDLGFNTCCYNGRFSIDSRYTPSRKIASALKSGIGLIEKAYILNVNPVHILESPRFKEISKYEIQKKGLKVKNSG